MIAAGSPEYAAARMHARLGQRPDAAAWRIVHESRGIPVVLDALAGTTLATIAAPLSRSPDLHALDRAATGAWRSLVAEASAWVVPGLGASVAWCAVLPLLPMLAYVARTRRVEAWMSHYPPLAALRAADADAAVLPPTEGELAPLAACWQSPESTGQAWLLEWRHRLPQSLRGMHSMQRLAAMVAQAMRRSGEARVHESEPLRARMEHELLRHFRRCPQDPSAVFAWLGLAALDMRRLRGEIAWRLALPDASPVP